MAIMTWFGRKFKIKKCAANNEYRHQQEIRKRNGKRKPKTDDRKCVRSCKAKTFPKREKSARHRIIKIIKSEVKHAKNNSDERIKRGAKKRKGSHQQEKKWNSQKKENLQKFRFECSHDIFPKRKRRDIPGDKLFHLF